jgi:hypothetical protein
MGEPGATGYDRPGLRFHFVVKAKQQKGRKRCAIKDLDLQGLPGETLQIDLDRNVLRATLR